jgi:hypothetical protein
MDQVRRLGAVAQLGERLPCTQEVRSSILLGSTNEVKAIRETPRVHIQCGAKYRSHSM